MIKKFKSLLFPKSFHFVLCFNEVNSKSLIHCLMPWFSAHVKSWEKVSLCVVFSLFCAKLFFHAINFCDFVRIMHSADFQETLSTNAEFHFVSKTKQFDLWFSCDFSLLSNFLGHWFCITRSLAQISTSSQFTQFTLCSTTTSQSPSLESLGDILCSLTKSFGNDTQHAPCRYLRRNFEGDFLGRNLFPCDVSIQQLFTQCFNSLIE